MIAVPETMHDFLHSAERILQMTSSAIKVWNSHYKIVVDIEDITDGGVYYIGSEGESPSRIRSSLSRFLCCCFCGEKAALNMLNDCCSSSSSLLCCCSCCGYESDKSNRNKLKTPNNNNNNKKLIDLELGMNQFGQNENQMKNNINTKNSNNKKNSAIISYNGEAIERANDRRLTTRKSRRDSEGNESDEEDDDIASEQNKDEWDISNVIFTFFFVVFLFELHFLSI